MASERNAALMSRAFHAAWMSIALGLAIELALIVAAATFGKSADLRPFIADLAGKISWSVLVCVGISVGTVAAAARGPVMGLLGLFSAPAAFALAKAAHKSAAQALDISIAATTSGPTAGQMIVLRAVEYATLGLAVGYISQKPWGRLPAYAALGLATGVTAATLVLFITLRTAAAPPSALALVSKGINEVLFPFGCSMVLYVLNAMGQRIRLSVAA